MIAYTVTYNKPTSKGIGLDFLNMATKLCRSLPSEAYVQGVCLQDAVLTIRSPKPIDDLREIAIKNCGDKYTVNSISTPIGVYP